MKRITAMIICAVFSFQAAAVEIEIPAGTKFYAEILDHFTTHKKTGITEGTLVNARVWRDVKHKGVTVIPAGAPVKYYVTQSQHARNVGRAGKLKLAAESLQLDNGQIIKLTGGYDKDGKGNVAGTAAMMAALTIFAVFVKGKNVEMVPGSIVSAEVIYNTKIQLPDGVEPIEDYSEPVPDFTAEVKYNVLRAAKKPKTIPFTLRNCAGGIDGASIVSINDEAIVPMPIEISSTSKRDDCVTAHGDVRLKKLTKQFSSGINRFEVATQQHKDEVIFEADW
ncbi:MAG: hypothetical protein MJA83_19385 [Gammaproteobacteria bacterium]|nr:hypothetical protein [Gammaproteobacteria bacterium]